MSRTLCCALSVADRTIKASLGILTANWEVLFRRFPRTVSDLSNTPTPQRNHLLAALPAEVQNHLLPYLELVPLTFGKVLYECGNTFYHVCFPTDSIVSLLYRMENGASGEISMVGNEGLVGIALFMGNEGTRSRAVVQSAGIAYRLPAQRLEAEFHCHGELQHLLLRYTRSLITQLCQTAVCNRYHSMDQQLCR